MKLPGWHGGGLSHKILYALVAVTLVVFVLFYFVGYNHPYSENPDFIEPRLTVAVIVLAMAISFLALGVTAWAVVMALKKKGKAQKKIHGINAALISTVVVAFTTLLLVASFLVGSSEAINVNGKEYNDNIALRGADMFVLSSVIMMVVDAAAVAWGTIKSHLNK